MLKTYAGELVLTAVFTSKQFVFDLVTHAIAGLIVVANLWVATSSIIAIRKGHSPRNIYILLFNIALANILIGAVKIFEQYYPKAEHSEIFCSFAIGFLITATLASVYSIGLIAIDRFLYILYGDDYRYSFNLKFVVMMVFKCWLLAGVAGFLPALGVRNKVQRKEFCSFRALAPSALVVATVFFGILPLAIILVLYGVALKCALRRAAKKIQFPDITSNFQDYYWNSNETVSNENCTTEVKPSIFNCCEMTKIQITSYDDYYKQCRAKKLVLLTAGGYFITWVPYFVGLIMHVFCDEVQSAEYCYSLGVAVESPLNVLSMINSLFSPLIYIFWHYEFFIFGSSKPPSELECMDERKMSDAERQRGSVTSWVSIDLQT